MPTNCWGCYFYMQFNSPVFPKIPGLLDVIIYQWCIIINTCLNFQNNCGMKVSLTIGLHDVSTVHRMYYSSRHCLLLHHRNSNKEVHTLNYKDLPEVLTPIVLCNTHTNKEPTDRTRIFQNKHYTIEYGTEAVWTEICCRRSSVTLTYGLP